MTTDNEKQDPFDQEFCAYLEYHLSKTFKNSTDNTISSLWCDGISHEVHKKSKKFVNDNRKIITKAWIGKDGQGEYEMTIYLGKKSLSRYARGLDLRECIPSENLMNWFNINTDNNTIELKLN